MKTAIIYLVIINIAAFCMYGMDKSAAIKQRQRIPNKVLIGMAVIGGSIGALAGMYTFRHKTQQKKYTITVPVILIVHILVGMRVLCAQTEEMDPHIKRKDETQGDHSRRGGADCEHPDHKPCKEDYKVRV